MSKTLKRKFGVRRIIGENRELCCIDCGQRAGDHRVGGDCPTINQRTGKPFKRNETFISLLKKHRQQLIEDADA